MSPLIRRAFPAVALLALALPSVNGQQVVSRKEPVFYAGKPQAAKAMPPGLRLSRGPAVSLGSLMKEEAARIDRLANPPRIGVHRQLPANITDQGRWDYLDDGRRVWRLTVDSDGAVALRILFEDFSAGEGKVWIYGQSDQVDGPYTGSGVFDDGYFWSASIESSSLTVEYEPAQAEAGDQVPFRLTKLSHRAVAYRANPDAPVMLRPIGLAGDRVSVGPLADELEDDAASCHLDVSCYSEWANAARMVGHFVFELGGSQASCSGTLVATRNNSLKPYFLTANHCIGDEGTARTVEVFWQYQTSQCRAPRPTTKGTVKSAVGANLLATLGSSVGDHSLLRLRDVPGGVVFSGWDFGEPAIGSNVVGIHHPQGSYKRISFGRRLASEDEVIIGGDTFDLSRYYTIEWTGGLTEPGSSGSPIFTAPGYLVGVLSYGWVSNDQCNAAVPRESGYGRFSAGYQAMRDYLEDLPFTEVTASPAEVTFRVRNGAVVGASSASVAINTQSATAVRFNARADAQYINLSANTGTTTASAPARITVSVDPSKFKTSGTFRSTVTLTQGSADPRFINVRVESVVDRSNVAVVSTPNPVYEQQADSSGMRFAFRIRLEEKAGVATRVDSMKINGEDYTSQIERLFGSNRIPASGALQADMKANIFYAPSDQYFEFGGIDEESGQRWYRTVSIRFLPAP